MTKVPQSSREDALSNADIKLIFDWLSNEDHNKKLRRLVFSSLTFGGYRANELLHQRPEWIHIGDNESIQLGKKFGFDKLDHVRIPAKGEFCTCRDCKLYAFIESQKEPDKEYNKAWYSEKKKEFDPKKIEGRYWQPKTKYGARLIPILHPIFKDELQKFYFLQHNIRLDYTRQWVWLQIEDIARGTWGYTEVPSKSKNPLYKPYRKPNRVLYPHALRATAATFWADNGMNATFLRKIMGWSNMETADLYVQSDEKLSLATARSIWDKIGEVK